MPVFAPAAGGMPEVFDDGMEGRLIPLDDAESAARKVLGWLNDAQTMRRGGEAARERFLERFEADRSGSRLLGFFDEVAAP